MGILVGGGSKAMDVGSCDIDVAEYVTVGVTVCGPATRLDAGIMDSAVEILAKIFRQLTGIFHGTYWLRLAYPELTTRHVSLELVL